MITIEAEAPILPSSSNGESSKTPSNNLRILLTEPSESEAGPSEQRTTYYTQPDFDDWPLPPLPMPPVGALDGKRNAPNKPPSPTRTPPPPPPPIPGLSGSGEEESKEEPSEKEPDTKGKGKEKVEESPEPVEEEDENAWMRYPPPNCLWQAPHVISETILNLVGTSIENVRARASEAEKARQEEEGAQQRRTEEEAAEAAKQKQKETLNGKDGEYYLPIIIPLEVPIPKHSFDVERLPGVDSARSSSDMSGSSRDPALGPSSGHRRHKHKLARILNRMGASDRAESSAMGAAKIFHRRSGQHDVETQSIKSTKDTRLRQLTAIAALLQKKRPQGSFIVHSVRGPGAGPPSRTVSGKGKGKENESEARDPTEVEAAGGEDETAESPTTMFVNPRLSPPSASESDSD